MLRKCISVAVLLVLYSSLAYAFTVDINETGIEYVTFNFTPETRANVYYVQAPYFYMLLNTLWFNDTKLNSTIDSRVGASSSKKGLGPWLSNDTEFIIFNESHYNTTKGAGSDTNESVRVHNHSIFLQNLTVANCGLNKKMVGVATNGSIECEDDIDTNDDTDTNWAIDNLNLNNVSSVLTFNETRNNGTIGNISEKYNETGLCLEINTTAWEQLIVHNASLASLASTLSSINSTWYYSNLTQASQLSTHNLSLSVLRLDLSALNDTNESGRVDNFAPFTCAGASFVNSFAVDGTPSCGAPSIPFPTYSFKTWFDPDNSNSAVATIETDTMGFAEPGIPGTNRRYIKIDVRNTGGLRSEYVNISIDESAPERCSVVACGENAAIDNGQYEWSCGGNGETGSALNVYPMFNGTIRGIAMVCNSAPSNARVNMTLDNAWTNCSVSYTSSPTIDSCAVPFDSTQGMQPRTDWDLGNSQCVVTFKICQKW